MTESAHAARYLALGDSYTIGEGVAAPERWPVRLAGLLRERGVDVADPTTIAETGWTSDELAEAIRRAEPDGPFDLVSLLIGVNDQYRGRDIERYRGAFRALLGRAVAFAGGEPDHVLVLSVPDWGITPFGKAEGRDPAKVAREIERFNTAAREESGDAGAHWLDITPVSHWAADWAGFIAEDGLHPSGEMYRLWARLALPTALAALGADPLA